MRIRTTYVYIHLDEGPVPAGRLDMTEDGRNSYATFQYGARYLRRPDRVPIDPAALPLPDPDAPAQTFRTARTSTCSMESATLRPMDGAVISCRKPLAPKTLWSSIISSQRESSCTRTSIRSGSDGGPERVHLGEKKKPSESTLILPCLPKPPSARNRLIVWTPI